MKIRKLFGDKAFYRMVLAIAVPVMVQSGITQFVSLLDNLMVGRIGTEEFGGVAIANQLIFVFNLCIFGGLSGARSAVVLYAIMDTICREPFRSRFSVSILRLSGSSRPDEMLFLRLSFQNREHFG